MEKLSPSFVLLLALLGCSIAADDVHKSAVRSRLRRDATTSSVIPGEPGEFGAHVGDRVQQGPEYMEDDEPCEDSMMDENKTTRKFCSLEGTWYNTLGSEMILNISADGLITGEYRTAVEKGWGSAGLSHSVVVGHSSPGSNPGFGFTVVWNEGESVTSWAGQCTICNGIETLHTSWILTTKVNSCKHEWMSDRIGQDTFTREEQSPGPRKALNTHTPRDFWRAETQTRN